MCGGGRGRRRTLRQEVTVPTAICQKKFVPHTCVRRHTTDKQLSQKQRRETRLFPSLSNQYTKTIRKPNQSKSNQIKSSKTPHNTNQLQGPANNTVLSHRTDRKPPFSFFCFFQTLGFILCTWWWHTQRTYVRNKTKEAATTRSNRCDTHKFGVVSSS